MRIVLATPLYPPDIAEPAPYVKELATRLATLHTITVVAYTRFPEHIPGVTLIAVDKRRALPVRLLTYFRALSTASAHVDRVYALNGASVELPLILWSLVNRVRVYIGIGDHRAQAHAREHLFLRLIERIAFSRAKRVITDLPPARPEIIPLDPYPTEAMAAYEHAWEKHIRVLDTLFHS